MTRTDATPAPRQVVAIGASAGGLAALKSMLPNLPVNQGVAYVLAQHMDPTHPSLLDQILQRDTHITVKAATDDERIEADCLYIIPPDKDGTVSDGRLHLAASEHESGPRHTVDILFLSVAKSYAAHAVGVILSGSGSDGLQGIRAIKAAEGLVIVQDPASAEFPGMPSVIIYERLADIIVPPEQIGPELSRLLVWPQEISPEVETEGETFAALVRTLVRKTGVAFDQYKESTLRRRIERRRIVTQQANLAAYLQLVTASDTEADLLLQDTLISVTEFFRDPETFDAIGHAIRTIVAGKSPGDAIRIWIPGCATGEEAFSIAILVADELGEAQRATEVQIFATDIDERAIDVARKSVYLKAALRDVAPALVEKYFVATGGTYQVASSIRDMVTFARHDMMRDPPFSRLDMVSCRNVLIYFKRAAQERLISVFHYILAPGGYLVLGPSESTGKLTELFEPVDVHAKIYVRRELEALPSALFGSKHTLPQLPVIAEAPPAGDDLEQRVRDRVFDQYVPPSVIVDQRFNVLHSHGDTARYLKLPEGDISVNLIDMAAAPLRVELRLALQKAEREQRTIRSHPIVLVEEGGRTAVTLIAMPLDMAPEVHARLLVLFEAQPVIEHADVTTPEENAAFRIRELEQELTATRDHLQTNIEELEASNEELQSVNEEYQSTTEELQSANEELQTTNEEMQSTNEELSTVNEELRVRSEDLAHANRDLESILNTAVSGIVVLDKDLRVTRYSAASRRIFDLLPTSIGKPLIAVGGAVDLALLSNEIQRALTNGAPIERELELGDKVFLVRLIPQLEGDDIGGMLISFVDATESLAAARESQRLATVLRDSSDAITVQRRDGQILAWNHGAERMYGYDEAEALSMNIDRVLPAAERAPWRALTESVYAGSHPQAANGIRLHRDGSTVEVSIVVTPLVDQNGEPYAVATTERDITLIREAEAQRKQAELALEARLTTAGEMAAGLAHELNQPVTSIIHFCDVALSIARDFDPKRRDQLIEVLTDATAQSQRAGDIIHNLRRFLGHRESKRSPHALNGIISEAAAFIRTDCERHGVELELSLTDGLPDVRVDSIQISQVLVNLAKNSIDAMKNADAGTPRITISTKLDDNRVHSVQVSVQDTGPGVDQDMAARLFEPFQTNKPNGLGMGLWISRSIIESHGGRLWADEAAAGGAAFHFSLPAGGEGEDLV